MNRNTDRLYFLLFGVLDFIALATALVYSLNVLNEYFSYFTVLSNILITFVFLVFGIVGMRKALKIGIVKLLYGPAVLYMSITGVVFWTILHGGADHAQLLPWVNIVLHGITPIAAFLGWVLFSQRAMVSYSNAYKWLSFPLLFVAYTLLRGFVINWYPYAILNPTKAGGYIGIFGYVFEIVIGAYIMGLILIVINNLHRK
ncbi:MAG TPA: Pr6Pr family membrane protein [Candidatus Levybacteria bacterium]|nr:Pr6Pr family membrane protein [Candidatus Levybacteria bacterium]